MNESQKDTQRALAAAKAIVDGRDPKRDSSSIMVTLEHLVATVLLATQRDARTAAAMVNEGLLPGVEERLAMYRTKEPPHD